MTETGREYGGWAESSWRDPAVDGNSGRFVTVGVDVGSVSSQAVIMVDGRILAYGNRRTGFDSTDSAATVLDFALEGTGMTAERIDYAVGTGYGRVRVPFADRTVTEVACHARGAAFIFGPRVRTVLDVGGQDIKALRCDERGKVSRFLMNDKCAAGTGRGMEVFADLVGVPVDAVGERSFQFTGPEPAAVSDTCVVFAKSEALGRLRDGWSVERVLASYCRAMAERIHALIERLGAAPGFAVTGGLAKNRGVMDRLTSRMGLERLSGGWDPQLAGAIGAALFGHTMCRKGKGRKR